MLDLISDLLKPFADMLPRVAHRPTSTEFCVVDSVVRGPYVTKWPTLHSPAFTHIEYYQRTPFPIDLEVQTLRTADGSEVTINASIMVQVYDPLRLRSSLGYEEYVGNIAMTARSCIQDFISGHNYRHGQESIDLLENLLWGAIVETSDEGCQLISLCIEDSARTSSMRFYGIPAILSE